MSEEKGARVVTDGPTTPPPVPKTPSSSASSPAHDRAWGVNRLGVVLSQVMSSDEYKTLVATWNRGELESHTFNSHFAEMVAVKFGNDKVLIDTMEASLIPGLRAVNVELAKVGKGLNVWMNGNRLARLEIENVNPT